MQDSLLLALFDTNLIQNIFIKLFKTYKYKLQCSPSEEELYKKYFSLMNNFKLVCSLFNNISKKTLFNLNIYNIKFKIPYNLYFKLSYVQKEVEKSYKHKNIDSMLLCSCENGFYDIIKTLIKQGKLNINKLNQYKGTPLLQATRFKNIQTIKELFKFENLDINLKSTHSGITPLIEASERGFGDIVELFLSRNDLNINIQDTDGRTALTQASRNDYENIVSLLLSQKNRININLKDRYQKTALDYAKEKAYLNAKIIQDFEKYHKEL